MLRFTTGSVLCSAAHGGGSVAVRESGKTVLDAVSMVVDNPRSSTMRGLGALLRWHASVCPGQSAFSTAVLVDCRPQVIGEVLVTCEKLAWLAAEGEALLRPERRPSVSGVGEGQRLCFAQHCCATARACGGAQGERNRSVRTDLAMMLGSRS